MPELPEVEVLRRSLEPGLVGRRVVGLTLRRSDLRERVSRRELERRCVGRRLIDVGRRAKYLLLGLEAGSVLVVHLGMSGRLTLAPAATAPEPHEHLSLYLDDGRKLRFRDPRRFGLVLVRSAARLDRDRHFVHLGVEPLDAAFHGDALRAAARGRRTAVKSFLMDTRIVAGVGNIYACEALYRAGIHPRRSVARISSRRWERLAAAVVAVLETAIEQGGTTLSDFTDGDGRAGYFQVDLAVYGREDEPCPRCRQGVVRRIIQSGRSTFYCPRCQR